MLKSANRIILICAVGVAALYAWLMLSPGTQGGFLLDDYGTVDKLEVVKENPDISFLDWFVDGGFKVASGRPISYLTFYFQYDSWPDSPGNFKLVNLILHFVNGCLVGIFAFLLFRVNHGGEHERRIFLASLLVALLWVLHPIQHSAVFYVVQRMTELSAFFIFLGGIGYILARRFWDYSKLRTSLGLCLLVAFFAVFAIFSKENGLLLFLFVLVIEFVGIPVCKDQRYRYVLVISSTLPVLLFVCFVAYRWDILSAMGDIRQFTPVERIMTQSRVVFEYLGMILMPRLDAYTLYHDNYEVSRGLFSPLTTFFSLIFWLILVGFAWAWRRRDRMFCFAVCWFLVGHLMESTFIPLELFFEHRNYIPSFSIMLFIVSKLFLSPDKYRGLRLSALYSYFFLVSWVSFLNVKTWESDDSIVAHWGYERPESFRSQFELARYYANRQYFDKTVDVFESYVKRRPDDLRARLIALGYSCGMGVDTREQIDSLVEWLDRGRLSVVVNTSLQEIFRFYNAGRCAALTDSDLLDISYGLLSRKEIVDYRLIGDIHFVIGEVYVKRRDFNNAIEHIKIANKINPYFDHLALEVGVFLSAGLYEEADDSYQALQDFIKDRKVLSARSEGILSALGRYVSERTMLEVPLKVIEN
jgi:protein O-mannosyl-transferase